MVGAVNMQLVNDTSQIPDVLSLGCLEQAVYCWFKVASQYLGMTKKNKMMAPINVLALHSNFIIGEQNASI